MRRYQDEDAREIEPWNTDLIKRRKENAKVRIEVDDGDRRVGSSSLYRCKEGQKIIGNQRRTCKQHGVWDGEEPKCTCKLLEYFTFICLEEMKKFNIEFLHTSL